LNPVSGLYFPLFSRVFPSDVAISVESGGFSRKQNCCKLLQVYVHFVGGLYLIKSLIPFLSGPGHAVLSSWNRRKSRSIGSRSAQSHRLIQVLRSTAQQDRDDFIAGEEVDLLPTMPWDVRWFVRGNLRNGRETIGSVNLCFSASGRRCTKRRHSIPDRSPSTIRPACRLNGCPEPEEMA
jgi:hypothetical protein